MLTLNVSEKLALVATIILYLNRYCEVEIQIAFDKKGFGDSFDQNTKQCVGVHVAEERNTRCFGEISDKSV